MYEYAERKVNKNEREKKSSKPKNVVPKSEPQNKNFFILPKEPVGLQDTIQFTKASELIFTIENEYQLDNDVNFKDSNAKDSTFGVELEVVHNDPEDLKRSVNEANNQELTDATAEIDGKISKVNSNPKLWSPVKDSSVKSDTGVEGIEWVSPIFYMDNPKWDMIKKLCKIITEYGGNINDTCSEHVHVGHKPLGYEREKFDNLFLLYDTFQDVIDIFARCGNKVNTLRKGADVDNEDPSHSGFAVRMEKVDGTSPKVYTYSSLLTNYSSATLESAIQYVNAVKERDETKTSDSTLRDCYLSFADNFLDDCNELKTLAQSFAKDNLMPFPKTFVTIKERQKIGNCDKTIETLQVLQRMVEMDLLLKSYTSRFGGDPLNHEGRYRALNIHQNFSKDSYKPTVEFRRFNGTIDAAVIQANAILTTSLMKAAGNIDANIIEEFLENNKSLDTHSKLFTLIDFITDDDAIKTLLLNAYAANLSDDEYSTMMDIISS